MYYIYRKTFNLIIFNYRLNSLLIFLFNVNYILSFITIISSHKKNLLNIELFNYLIINAK